MRVNPGIQRVSTPRAAAPSMANSEIWTINAVWSEPRLLRVIAANSSAGNNTK